jgi:V8-like Glu-specific endopeptidase
MGLDIMRVPRADDRVRVSKYAEYPWRCICSLRILTAAGTWMSGTGWLVSPRVVVTAGDCVYQHDAGGWARQVEVIPGRNGAQQPYGAFQSMALRSVLQWTEQHDYDFDYGAVLLRPEDRPGDRLGWFGYAPRDDAYLRQATLNLAGYPDDGGRAPGAEEGTQWFASGLARQIEARQVTYEISASPRQPGCPVWEMTASGERFGVAIHAWSTTYANGGTRITQDVFDHIAGWVREAA